METTKTNREIEVFVALKKRGKNYSWLAEQLNISPAYLSDLLHCARNSKYQLNQINKLLGLNLIGDKNE